MGHGIDRLRYEYLSYQYLQVTAELKLDPSEDMNEYHLSEKGLTIAVNRVFDRMVSRSEEFPFLRAPQRKNSVVPAIR